MSRGEKKDGPGRPSSSTPGASVPARETNTRDPLFARRVVRSGCDRKLSALLEPATNPTGRAGPDAAGDRMRFAVRSRDVRRDGPRPGSRELNAGVLGPRAPLAPRVLSRPGRSTRQLFVARLWWPHLFRRARSRYKPGCRLVPWWRRQAAQDFAASAAKFACRWQNQTTAPLWPVTGNLWSADRGCEQQVQHGRGRRA